jgi:hypothetical protein
MHDINERGDILGEGGPACFLSENSFVLKRVGWKTAFCTNSAVFTRLDKALPAAAQAMSPENPAILSAMVRVVTSRIVPTAHRARTMPVAGLTASCGAPTRRSWGTVRHLVVSRGRGKLRVAAHNCPFWFAYMPRL